MRRPCEDCGHELDQHARQANGAYRCRSFGCGCEIAAAEDQDDLSDDRPPARRLTRHEQLEGLADRGVDTWEDYRGEK
jgi:hypothetical protein